MKIVNTQEFDEITAKDGLVLVDFFADWCGPCKMLAPVLEEVAAKYEGKLEIVKVNVDQSQDLAQRYGVMSIPTLIAFKGGKAVKQSVGFPAEKHAGKHDRRSVVSGLIQQIRTFDCHHNAGYSVYPVFLCLSVWTSKRDETAGFGKN